MKKVLSALLIPAFFYSNVAMAQQKTVELPKVETPQGEIDPGEALSPMKLGQKSPFSGVLLSPKAVASIIARFVSIDDEVKLARDEAVETSNEACRNEKSVIKIQSTADMNILQARIENNERIIKHYEKSLNEVQASQTDPALLIGLGAVGGAAVTVLTVFAVSQAIK